LLDVYTTAGRERLVCDVAAELVADGAPKASLVGYENHSGRTYLQKGATPLAKVRYGSGNNGADGYEGAVYKGLFGTYIHGPLLPKNPEFADHLLQLALQRRYGQEAPVLNALDDRLEQLAHEARLHPGEKRSWLARLLSI
ncbi:MAG TPA: hypothetical protein VFK80_12360, partial [Limnochordia bacterium]|nr:hypothetical protein [Limnochordia bacterium]